MLSMNSQPVYKHTPPHWPQQLTQTNSTPMNTAAPVLSCHPPPPAAPLPSQTHGPPTSGPTPVTGTAFSHSCLNSHLAPGTMIAAGSPLLWICNLPAHGLCFWDCRGRLLASMIGLSQAGPGHFLGFPICHYLCYSVGMSRGAFQLHGPTITARRQTNILLYNLNYR